MLSDFKEAAVEGVQDVTSLPFIDDHASKKYQKLLERFRKDGGELDQIFGAADESRLKFYITPGIMKLFFKNYPDFNSHVGKRPVFYSIPMRSKRGNRNHLFSVLLDPLMMCLQRLDVGNFGTLSTSCSRKGIPRWKHRDNNGKVVETALVFAMDIYPLNPDEKMFSKGIKYKYSMTLALLSED